MHFLFHETRILVLFMEFCPKRAHQKKMDEGFVEVLAAKIWAKFAYFLSVVTKGVRPQKQPNALKL